MARYLAGRIANPITANYKKTKICTFSVHIYTKFVLGSHFHEKKPLITYIA